MKIRSRPKAHLLVSELMVLTNSAGQAGQGGTASPCSTGRRTSPSQGVLRHLADAPRNRPKWSKRWPRRAGNQSARRPGEAMYAPSTSPLRRYPDMINERRSFPCSGTKPRWSKGRHPASPCSTAHLDAAGQVQRFRPRYWKLLYFGSKGDRWWPPSSLIENDAFVTVNMPKEQMIVRRAASSSASAHIRGKT